jgi:histone H1/5
MPPKAKTSKSHFDLAKEAILALKDRTGSSTAAIKAWIAKAYPSVKVVPHLLRQALKKGVEGKKLVQIKASYKVAVAEKKVKATTPKAKATTPKKKSAPKKKAPAKKAEAAAEGAAAAPAKVGLLLCATSNCHAP